MLYATRMTKTVVALHGWGGSQESWTQLREALTGKDVELYTPDLPGFGNEPEPQKPFTVDDYADWVIAWITNNVPEHSLKPLTLIGHSHGGRTLIKIVTRKQLPFTIEHLVLCASAGIRHPRHFKRILGLTLAKTGKFFMKIPGLKSLAPLARKILYKLVRVHDYEKASPLMQTTLQLVTKEDLRNVLPQITVRTDLFWGKQDGMTPYSDALIMHKAIPNSTLHSFNDVRHAVHRAAAKEIAEVVMG